MLLAFCFDDASVFRWIGKSMQAIGHGTSSERRHIAKLSVGGCPLLLCIGGPFYTRNSRTDAMISRL